MMRTVSVVGLGKVGLPLAVQCAQSGFHVIGCDTEARVVDAVNRGVVPQGILEAGLKRALKRTVNAGLLEADVAVSKVARRCRVIIIIVPLLIGRKLRPAFGHLDAATAEVGRGLRRGRGAGSGRKLPHPDSDRNPSRTRSRETDIQNH